MKLYTFFRSSASFRVRIALNHKGLKYEQAGVSLPKGEHLESGYKTLNPQGLVPALEDGGRLLTQSLAIIEYLDEIHPGPKLLPVAPLDRAYVRAFSQIIACEIHPLNNLRTRKYIAKTYKLDEEGVNGWYRHWIGEGFAMMEAFLAQERKYGKYVFHDQVTMADGDADTRSVHEGRRVHPRAAFETTGRSLMGVARRCLWIFGWGGVTREP
jgi:maleylacetoacetate isomerase